MFQCIEEYLMYLRVHNKHEPYIPFWTDRASPGQHWAELAEALPAESEVCGHRAWPLACIHT